MFGARYRFLHSVQSRGFRPALPSHKVLIFNVDGILGDIDTLFPALNTFNEQ